jgi:hypothetical protein
MDIPNDDEIIKQMLMLKAEDMHDLIIKVGEALLRNEQVISSHPEAIALAITMIEYASKLFTQHGCTMLTTIHGNGIDGKGFRKLLGGTK